MIALQRHLIPLAMASLVAACGAAPAPTPLASPTVAGPTAVMEPTPVTPPQVTLQPSASTAVTLGLYSGRPNPQWELTADQDTHLHQIVASLPRVSGVAPQGGLGYSGFTVAVIGPDGRGQVVIAYAKTVALQGIASTWHWRDEAGLVERFLLDTGKPSLAAAEYAAAKQALDNLLP